MTRTSNSQLLGDRHLRTRGKCRVSGVFYYSVMIGLGFFICFMTVVFVGHVM